MTRGTSYNPPNRFEKLIYTSQHFPDRSEKVLNRIREMRDGKLNDPRFGHRMQGQGLFAEQIGQMFDLACKKAGIQNKCPSLSVCMRLKL
ncbi:MAG: hypothetical protein A3B70_03255 [Deltaproteobacteria bacterium RIFCSPHIGHO2_02_FULL_40_11]|nr:MAG: hypothetical protein A3B70_03255 [Deltaproteobacteria bacterium RIFCSPHIGHO2_02_FULL_40_11]